MVRGHELLSVSPVLTWDLVIGDQWTMLQVVSIHSLPSDCSHCPSLQTRKKLLIPVFCWTKWIQGELHWETFIEKYSLLCQSVPVYSGITFSLAIHHWQLGAAWAEVSHGKLLRQLWASCCKLLPLDNVILKTSESDDGETFPITVQYVWIWTQESEKCCRPSLRCVTFIRSSQLHKYKIFAFQSRLRAFKPS